MATMCHYISLGRVGIMTTLLVALGVPAQGALQGDPDVHDPSTLIKEGNRYWVFGTGPGLISRYSTNLIHWTAGPRVFNPLPSWVTNAAPGNNGDLWAPDIIHHNNQFHLYYCASVFGRNTSGIGLATTPTLDPANPNFGWTDQGIVVQTTSSDNYNALDPSVIKDPGGNLWLVFGSYWSGIKLIQLDPATGKRIAPNSPMYSLADYPAIEAAYIYHHNGYYYLFVNWDSCCSGVDSTYNIRVGRSASITGPYMDRNGVNMLNSGGSLFLETTGRYVGPGHMGILFDEGQFHFTYHYYDANNNGSAAFDVRPLRWDSAGWPVSTNDWSAYYSFRVGARDENGQYDGRLIGGAGTERDTSRGTVLRFSGTNQFVNLPSGVANAGAIAAWVKWDGGPAWQRIFDFGTGTNRYAMLTPAAAGGLPRFVITTSGGGGAQALDAPTALSVGVWTHLAVTLNGSRGIFYMNGLPVKTNTAMTLVPGDLHIRSNYLGKSQFPADPYFRGRLDSVRFFGRALSSTEIAVIASADPVEPETLVPRDAQWRYWDLTTNPGSTWMRPEFNDSSWPSGRAELGFGDGDETTVINSTSSRITTFFRTTFVSSNADFGGITARLRRDDGAVVWLNGQEVWRSNMPGTGTIGAATQASSSIGEMNEDLWHERSFSPWAIRHGTNVVAVEVHQFGTTSSDLSMNFELDGWQTSQVDLVPAGGVWRYLDNGVVPGSNWTAVAFDDSTWKLGVGQLGYGDGDEAAVLDFGPTPTNKFITTWFRCAFVVEDPSALSLFGLSVVRDDGLIVYLNGTEIFRNNLPIGPLTPQTLAINAIGGADENTIIKALVAAAPLLRSGTNVLAVEVHQASSDSTDLSFDLEFSAMAARPSPPELSAARAANLLRLRWPTNALGFRPWQNTNLLSTNAWQPAPGTLVRNGPWWEVSVGFSPSVRFFQLRNQ